VLHQLEVGGRIQCSGHYARPAALIPERAPEQIAPAAAAKAALRPVRRSEPYQRLIFFEGDAVGFGASGGDEMAAGPPALRAMTGNDVAKSAAHGISDPSTKTSAPRNDALLLQCEPPGTKNKKTALIVPHRLLAGREADSCDRGQAASDRSGRDSAKAPRS